jgi:hypothetical protein
MSIETYLELKARIADPEYMEWEELVVGIVNLYNQHEDTDYVQDLVLRLMERKEELSGSYKLIEHLIGELGLFPYLNEKVLGYRDKVRQSLFSAPDSMEKVFHVKQAEVFHRLMSGENVVLSAPTSFGKSLIIEAVIASKEFANIVIVVPTIALIDELKNKLNKYKDHYKIITQSTQLTVDRNVFIFTQERVLECKDLGLVDFFIIDEFYKLSPSGKDDYRCDRLNLAFHKLYQVCNRFYMLGPNIDGLSKGLQDSLKCQFIKYDNYKTVSTNEYYYDIESKGKDSDIDISRDRHLFDILKGIGQDQQTVIYCKSPQRANSLMEKILDYGILDRKLEGNLLSGWLKNTYHIDWSLAKAIEYGVACHHAKLPRSLGSIIVEWFNESKINILICTSTLIEGVNTNAKNIVIYDDCITRKTKLDSFTFNNISGRSGRMFEHFVGDVYILGRRPENELPLIDIPIVTQSDKASDSMLLQIFDELDESKKEKISRYMTQDVLPLSILKKHQGISPDKLLLFANDLLENCGGWNPRMTWSGAYPTDIQLNHLTEILWKYFNVSTLGGGCVRSAKHLRSRIRDVMNNVTDQKMIENEYTFRKKIDSSYRVDEAVQVVFAFKRNLISYNLPKIIYAINDIQKEIFPRFGYSVGDYTAFVVKLENFFELPSLTILEEFGIPFQVSKKIVNYSKLTEEDSVDDVIVKIKQSSNTHPVRNALTDFEKILLDRAVQYL